MFFSIIGCFNIFRNMDALVFMEFLEHLTEKLEEKVDEVRYMAFLANITIFNKSFTF